jgi:type II secretory pathway component PulC
MVWVALVATLLTLVSAGLQAQEGADQGPEVLKIWLEPSDQGQAGPAAKPDGEVFSASDEFEPVTVDRNQEGQAKPPIQTIASDRLTLVATIVPVDQRDAKDRLAMVGYDGHDYELKEGSKVGSNNGFVKEITETYVIIEEEVENDLGEKVTKEVLLRLPN